jgi:hypothetical protein
VPHSDRTTSDDALTREVTRQLADTAPPAPPWDAVAGRFGGGHTPDRSAGHWWPLAMAGVVALVVAGGFLFLGPQSAEPEPPPVQTLPRPTSSVVGEWLDANDSATVQACLARSTLQLARSADVGPLEEDLDLTGVTPERAELASFLSPILVMRAAVESGALDTATVASVTPLLDAWSEADEVVADSTSSVVERRTALDRFGEESDRFLAAPSTVDCVFDTTGVAAAIESASTRAAPLIVARCLSALGLDRALDEHAIRPDESATATLEAALSGFTVWNNRPSPSIAELGAAVVAARDAEPGARAALAEEARLELGRLGQLDRCPTWTDPAVLDPD